MKLWNRIMLITIINIYRFVMYKNFYVFFSFLDVPNEGVYMVCGVLIAMVLVAVIIVILAVTIRWVENVTYTYYLFLSKSALVWRCSEYLQRTRVYIVLWGNMVATPDETRTGDPWTLRNHTHTHAHAKRTLTHSHALTHLQT